MTLAARIASAALRARTAPLATSAIGLLRRAVPHRDLVPLVEKKLRDGDTHRAQAQDGNFLVVHGDSIASCDDACIL
jgi:hypothetical protein